MNILLNPWVWLAFLAWTAFVGAAGWQTGREQARDACDAEKLVSVTRAIEQADAIREQDFEVLSTHEARVEHTRTVFQTIEHEVIRYVQAHPDDVDCLGPDGLRLWRAANANSLEALSSPQSDVAVPGVARPRVGQGQGAAGQSRGGGEAVPRMQGQASGLGGVGAQ
jgi:hypothetical protein